MSEGRAQILEMLVAGRVTVEQAARLLAALDAASPAAPREPVNQTGRQRQRDERADNFFANLTLEQLIKLRDHDVSRAFVDSMRVAGRDDLSVDELVELYDDGVDAAFVREMHCLGFANLTPSEWAALRDHGVDGH
jgi:hypothetical protein